MIHIYNKTIQIQAIKFLNKFNKKYREQKQWITVAIIKKIKKIIITRNKKHKIITNALRFSSKKVLKTHNKIINEI